jgi:hypothetical protein
MATGIGTVNPDLALVVPEHGHFYLMGKFDGEMRVLSQIR